MAQRRDLTCRGVHLWGGKTTLCFRWKGDLLATIARSLRKGVLQEVDHITRIKVNRGNVRELQILDNGSRMVRVSRMHRICPLEICLGTVCPTAYLITTLKGHLTGAVALVDRCVARWAVADTWVEGRHKGVRGRGHKGQWVDNECRCHRNPIPASMMVGIKETQETFADKRIADKSIADRQLGTLLRGQRFQN